MAVLCTLAIPAKSLRAATKSVMLAPTRVVFEGRTRSAVVRLINPNNEACSFKVELVAVRMDDFGNRAETKTPDAGELFAQKLIRFSPRRTTLPPRGLQTLRLMVRKPGDLPEGEYRAHLKVTPIPDAPTEKQGNGQEAGKVSISIDLLFSISIPIIIRHGEGDVAVTPKAVLPRRSDTGNKLFLETVLERKGLHSAYADVLAYHTPADGSQPRYKIGEIKGISFYSQNTKQTLRVPLLEAYKTLPSNGTIDIEILDRETEKPEMLGSGSFLLE